MSFFKYGKRDKWEEEVYDVFQDKIRKFKMGIVERPYYFVICDLTQMGPCNKFSLLEEVIDKDQARALRNKYPI